jgi:hypothetical protein
MRAAFPATRGIIEFRSDGRKINEYKFEGANGHQEILRLDAHAVGARARHYNQFHNDMDDCYLVAESEEAALDVVLTFGRDLLRHLRHRANISLMTSSEYEDSLN